MNTISRTLLLVSESVSRVICEVSPEALWYTYSQGNSQYTIIKVKNNSHLGLMCSYVIFMESSGIKISMVSINRQNIIVHWWHGSQDPRLDIELGFVSDSNQDKALTESEERVPEYKRGENHCSYFLWCDSLSSGVMTVQVWEFLPVMEGILERCQFSLWLPDKTFFSGSNQETPVHGLGAKTVFLTSRQSNEMQTMSKIPVITWILFFFFLLKKNKWRL